MRLVSLNVAGSLEIDQNLKVASRNFQKNLFRFDFLLQLKEKN